MKLQIEKWVDETKPFKESDTAHDFFEESVRCYKIGAYKSAFIMSYLAFKTTIRNRILECTYGKELVRSNSSFWENEIITKLEDDDLWEGHLNSIVEASCVDEKNRKDLAILHFIKGDKVKLAYNNWKSIRNDCAHAKRYVTIDSSTVECFWNYLIDNLSKFYVLGGEEYLSRELGNIYKYYNYPDIEHPKTVSALMSDVNVICNKNTHLFFTSLFEKLNSIAKSKGLINDENQQFWRDILESRHDNIRDGLVKVISKDALLFFDFYNYFPQLLQMSLSLNPKFIIDDLSKWLNKYAHPYYYGKVFWNILIEVLDNYKSHIDVDEIVTSRTIDLINSFMPDERKLRVLNSNNVFKKYILNVSPWFFKTDPSSQFDNYVKFQSRDSEYVELCLEYLEWDIEFIEFINYTLVALDLSMKSRSNTVSRMNGFSFKARCERIICKNKAKIINTPDVDLTNYNEILNILNSCKSDKDSTHTSSN